MASIVFLALVHTAWIIWETALKFCKRKSPFIKGRHRSVLSFTDTWHLHTKPCKSSPYTSPFGNCLVSGYHSHCVALGSTSCLCHQVLCSYLPYGGTVFRSDLQGSRDIFKIQRREFFTFGLFSFSKRWEDGNLLCSWDKILKYFI